MIRIKGFVTESLVDFITILEVDFPRHRYEHCFHVLFTAV